LACLLAINQETTAHELLLHVFLHFEVAVPGAAMCHSSSRLASLAGSVSGSWKISDLFVRRAVFGCLHPAIRLNPWQTPE
jgi:hypothetical protein